MAFVSRKNKSKTGIAAPSVPKRAQRLALFGPPPLIEGEDAAAYDQLLAHICAALKLVDAKNFRKIAHKVFRVQIVVEILTQQIFQHFSCARSDQTPFQAA